MRTVTAQPFVESRKMQADDDGRMSPTVKEEASVCSTSNSVATASTSPNKTGSMDKYAREAKLQELKEAQDRAEIFKAIQQVGPHGVTAIQIATMRPTKSVN